MLAPNSQAGNIHYSFLLFVIPIVIAFKRLKVQLLLVGFVYLAFIVSHYITIVNPLPIGDYYNPTFGVFVFGLWMLIALAMLRFFENEIQFTENQLHEKNTELQEFSHIASHDLKEPLRTISVFSKLLRDKHESELSENAKQYLSFIESGTMRMNTLLEDLAEYSMVDGVKQEVCAVDLNKILKDVISDLQGIIQETKTIIKYDKLPIVKANESHMAQLFQNLISNGIKFQAKGKSTVPQITISSFSKDEFHTITFTDNGIGIAKEYIDTIFGKFKRLNNKDEYEGTGLGLATCKKIVEFYNGEISIESELGLGTTFKIKLIK